MAAILKRALTVPPTSTPRAIWGYDDQGTSALRRRLRPALLRWAVSVFCALVGALMLIAPHQFAGASFAPLRPWLTAWGAAFFAAGVA